MSQRWPTAHDASDPTVSVLVLCFNTGKYVVEALETVRQQSYRDFEVIVVDDGSTDDSVQIISAWSQLTGFPLELVQNSCNRGIPASFNRAVGLARGKYVTSVCDDLWEPWRLQRVVDCFEALPTGVSILFGDAVVVDEHGKETGQILSPATTVLVLGIPNASAMTPELGECAIIPGPTVREALFYRCIIPGPAAIVRRRLYDDVGMYDESVAIDDLDFYFRASSVCDFAYLRAPLVRYRKHAGSFTSGQYGEYLTSLQEILLRYGGRERLRVAVVRTHVREEAYRVAIGLIQQRTPKAALSAVVRYYIPNARFSTTCLKELARVLLLCVQQVRPIRRLLRLRGHRRRRSVDG